MSIDRQLDLFDEAKNRRLRRQFLEFCYRLVASGDIRPKKVRQSTIKKVRRNLKKFKK